MREQEAAAQPLAEPEAREIPERGGEPGEREDQGEADLALGGHDTAEHDRGLAGGHEPDEGAGLEKGQGGHQGVGPGAERPGEIGEGALEVGRLDDTGGHGGEARAYEERDGPGDDRDGGPRHAATFAATGSGTGSTGRRTGSGRGGGGRGGGGGPDERA